jgi:pantoate--beta-alanine ligase
LREHLNARSDATIGLVPTMGALHEGHLSLLRLAAADNDIVVISLFVNPTQFAANEDLSTYPRDEARDARLAAAAGATILFAPSAEEIYPDGFATVVEVSGLTEPLCGATRGSQHFRGVTTVVAKLFNIVGPDNAYFGQKDAQQVVVIKRMVRDLDFPVHIVVGPTVREPDGLAMSSRNAYLDAKARERALGLSRALASAQSTLDAGTRDARTVAAAARTTLAEHGIEPEYTELVAPETLIPVEVVDDDVLLAIAARVGSARLIDNAILKPRK